MKNKQIIYKKDLKFHDNFDLENSDWDNDGVKDMYNEHKNKPKIELRIKDSESENYEYLDLSKMALNDELLKQLISLDRIKYILKKICFLDLSNNDLTVKPDLSEYKNIIYLNISHNNIKGSIIDNNVIELSCEYNKIKSIVSSSITKLSANNNLIETLNTPNIKMLVVNNNNLNSLDSNYDNLEYLECINNNLTKIGNFKRLSELFIGYNNVEEISKLDAVRILNCVNNPIKKIRYFNNLKMLMSSTAQISSRYNINNISKIKNDFFIDLKTN